MKKTIIAGAATLAAVVLSAGVVFASGLGNSLTIGTNGNVRLEGTISSISGSTWDVSSWGGTWAVDVSAAKVSNASTSLSDFTTGETVIVNGTAASGSLAVTASSVAAVNAPSNGSSTSAMPPKARMGFWGGFFTGIAAKIGGWFGIGTVSNVNASANTFTLTNKKGNSETVDVNASTTVRVGTTTPMTGTITGIANGMHAFVGGSASTNASATVNASTVVAGNASTSLKRAAVNGFFHGWLHL